MLTAINKHALSKANALLCGGKCKQDISVVEAGLYASIATESSYV